MIKVRFPGKSKTFGLFRLEPNCPISKTVAAFFRTKFLKISFVELLLKNGGEVFYSGHRDKDLDEKGLTYFEETEE